LTNNTTLTTFDALSPQFNKHRFASYGDGSKYLSRIPSENHIPLLTGWKLQVESIMFNPKPNLSIKVACSNLWVAFDTKSMVRQTRGHTSFPFRLAWSLSKRARMSTFFDQKYALVG
jgi:hypothetical protein